MIERALLPMQSSTLSAEHRGTALVPDASSYLSGSSTAVDAPSSLGAVFIRSTYRAGK